MSVVDEIRRQELELARVIALVDPERRQERRDRIAAIELELERLRFLERAQRVDPREPRR